MSLDDWITMPVIYQSKIKNFEFLIKRDHIKEIENGYYCLNHNFDDIEFEFYNMEANKLMDELEIKDVEKEVKEFIGKLNLYNELKDVGQALIGKIAELRGATIREIHEEMEVGGDA
jgi:hypothetical protein